MSTTSRSANSIDPDQLDVGGISEITILPDGRVYVLGLSKAVLAVLQQAVLAKTMPTEHLACDESVAKTPAKENRA